MLYKLSNIARPGGVPDRFARSSEGIRVSNALSQRQAAKLQHEVHGSTLPSVVVIFSPPIVLPKSNLQCNPIHYLTLPQGLLANSILESFEAIAHQTHCGTSKPAGLAANLATSLPYGCPYSYRESLPTKRDKRVAPGSLTILSPKHTQPNHPIVISMNA